MPPANAGKFDQRISIIAVTPGVRNSFGEVKPKENIIGRAWCSVDALSGNRLFEARQIMSETTHEVRTHWRDDIEPGMLLEWTTNGNARRLHVLSAPVAGRREATIVMLCKEAV